MQSCWVSRHAKLQSVSTTDLPYISAFVLMKVCVAANTHTSVVFLHSLTHFVGRSFICLSHFSQRSGFCTLTFFCCRWGLECAGLQVLKITKQHEAAACKLWMRSQSANTARGDMRGDFVLGSPLVVSYLYTVFFLFVLCAFQITITGFENVTCLEESGDCIWDNKNSSLCTINPLDREKI